MSKGTTKAQKAADNARFAKDLYKEVECIDRLLGLNRDQRRSMGIILHTKHLEDAKAYLEREIAAVS